MIYNSLKILPIIVFFEILETQNYELLSDKNTPKSKLKELWEKLYDEYANLEQNQKTNQTFKFSQKIGSLISKFKSVKLFVDCLRARHNEELIELLKKDGYKLSDKTFKTDLERIETEAEALLVRAETFKNQLPKQTDKKVTIFDVMSSYSLILGFDFDYNTISVLKFISLQKQIKLKIKALENNG